MQVRHKNNNSKLCMKQAARERTLAWFTVCVLCLYPVVTLRELSIRVTNLPFSWLPRIGLPGMDCKPAGQRSTRNKYAARGILIMTFVSPSFASTYL